MNKVILIGRITKDVEVKEIGANLKVSNFSLAVSTHTKDEEGNYKSEFINIVAWNETAENLKKYTGKGDLISVEGRLQTRSYEKDGAKVYVTEVVAERIVYLQKVNKEN